MANALPRFPLSAWLAPLRHHPRLSLAGGAALIAVLAVLIHLSMAAEQARRQEAERALEVRLRQETHLQLQLLQRQEAALKERERRKQQLAAQDTRAFQQAALEADLASQTRDLRVLRRSALERQAAEVDKEKEERRQALQELLKGEIKDELAKEDSMACITAYGTYQASKRDPASSPEKLASELKALRQLCGN